MDERLPTLERYLVRLKLCLTLLVGVLFLFLALALAACQPVQDIPTATPWSPTPTAIPPTATATVLDAPTPRVMVQPTATATTAPTRTSVAPTPTPRVAPTPRATVPPTPRVVPTSVAPTVAPPTPPTTVPPTPTIAPPTPTATVPPTPTVAPTATAPPATRIPGRPALYEPFTPPEHLAYVWWQWRDPLAAFDELEVAFTVHNDVETSQGLGGNGLYMMLAYGWISDIAFYFGVQSDVQTGTPPYEGRGKGAIFSRWETRDLSLARFAEADGWAQSSGHEGDFIGVRRLYPWGTGDYTARLAPEEHLPDGVWYGVWVTDLSTEITTWIGSLWFPLGGITSTIYSTLEIYGGPIAPIDIPMMHVSMRRPSGDQEMAQWGDAGYSGVNGVAVPNADIAYVRQEDAVHFRVGGLTERTTAPWAVRFGR